ncbi:methylase MraW [Umbelopsis sp. AD052]|nr:methylase MraW [Umbelopsis sp. AD052]
MSLRPFTRSGWAGIRSLVRSINTAAASSTHVPVMLLQVLEFLKPKSGAVYCDATYGDGGYTRAILDSCDCTVVAIDQDPVAYDRAKEVAVLEQYRGRLIPILGRFGEIDNLVKEQLNWSAPCFDGMVFDIGVSSGQIDTPERGFSYKSDGPLDMRMFARGSDDQEPYVPKSITAYEVVNFYSRQQLADIIYQYGGDRLSRKIADAIVNARVNEPIKSTLALAQIVQAACPQPRWSRGGDDMVRNSAARTFQAIRIHINDEVSSQRGSQKLFIRKVV